VSPLAIVADNLFLYVTTLQASKQARRKACSCFYGAQYTRVED